MKIAIYNLEPKYINLALEKIKLYHQAKGDDVEDYFALKHNFYDKIYASSIFTNTNKTYVTDDMEIGGTGFPGLLKKELPKEIDEMKPKLNVGFTSRGCIRKCPFCFVEGTKILTDKGLKNIEDIVIGDMILDTSGLFNKVTNLMNRNYEGNIIEFNTQFNDVHSRVTEKHKFPTVGEEDKDLQSLDVLKVSTIKNHKTSLDIKKYIKYKNFVRNPIKKNILKNNKLKLFCELLGWYLAEGSLIKCKKRPESYTIRFSLSKKEVKEVERIKYIVEKVFNIKAVIAKYDYATTLDVAVYNKELGILLKELCGKGAKHKYIHKDVLLLKSEYILELLKAYFKGDGSLVKTDNFYRITSASVSYSLSLCIALLLRGLGYRADVRCRDMKDSYIDGRRIQSNNKIFFVYVRSYDDVVKLSKIFFSKNIIYNRKTRFSTEEKKQIIKKINNDKNKKIEDRCKKNGICFQTYYRWNNEIENKIKCKKDFEKYQEVTMVNKKNVFKDRCRVYNLTVENTHTYNVNGILTNNCVVPQKEGNIRPIGDIYDLWDGESKELILWDNNILAIPDHFEKICKQAQKEKLRIDFNQGLDIRLLTEDMCKTLKATRMKEYRFAFDNKSLTKIVEEKCKILNKYKIYALWYVLVGFDSNFVEELQRVYLLNKYNQRVYVMRHENCRQDRRYTGLANWTNSICGFRAMSFEEYLKSDRGKGYKHLFKKEEIF